MKKTVTYRELYQKRGSRATGFARSMATASKLQVCAHDALGSGNRDLSRRSPGRKVRSNCFVMHIFTVTCLKIQLDAAWSQAAGMQACSDQALAFAISNGAHTSAMKQRIDDQIAELKWDQEQELAASESAAFAGSLLLSMAGISSACCCG
jgi:hypothetical protein